MSEETKDKAARREMREKSLRMRAASFRDILWDAVNNFDNNSDGNQAAAIALYAILSAIPLFILTIIAAGSFFSSNPNIQADIFNAVRNFHPYLSGDILEQLGQIEGKREVLGWAGVLGLIWLSATIFNTIESALNMIFLSPRKRHYLVSKLMAICMIPAAWVIGGISILLSYAAALFAREPLVLPGGIELLLTLPAQIVLRYVLPYLMIVILAAVIYRVIPTLKIRFSVVLAGSAVFAFLLEIAKQFFTWYVTNYTRYNVIFGSLETVVILVIWVFYVALIFLFCAEMMSSYERHDALLIEKALLQTSSSRLKVDERLFRKFGHAYPANSIIFNEGEAGSKMFYVISGRVVLERLDGSARKPLAEMGPGEYFGEMAALIDIRRTATARALEDSHLAVIDNATFCNLIHESRDVALHMLREFSTRLRNSNIALEEFTILWTRLVIIIHFLDQPHATLEDHIAGLSRLTQKEPSEIRTLLSKLADEHILIIKDNKVAEIDREKMWAMLDPGILKKFILEEGKNTFADTGHEDRKSGSKCIESLSDL